VSASRGFRRPRRSGISNLIGAIFFILIVALALSIMTVMFAGSSTYIGGIHSTNQQGLQAVNSKLTVSGVAFGGELAKGAADIPVNNSLSLPLLPISNMNFSSGIQGWYVSESYPALVDSAIVNNSLDSNCSKVPVVYNGTTTSATSTVLTDTGASWKPNQWVADTLTYTSGPAIGESQVIISNTATTITTTKFSPPPLSSGGDDFSIEPVNLCGSSYVDLHTATNYAKQSNDGEVFALTVKNTSPHMDDIAKVTILVDTYFNATATSRTPPPTTRSSPTTGRSSPSPSRTRAHTWTI